MNYIELLFAIIILVLGTFLAGWQISEAKTREQVLERVARNCAYEDDLHTNFWKAPVYPPQRMQP